MENHINLRTLKNAEFLLRITMVITLFVAGVSKFFSQGNFYAYYFEQFSNEELRINLPPVTFDLYLKLIPFIEVAIALALLTSFKRRFFIVVWIIYFITLEIGHYIMEEFTTVDLMIPFILLGTAAYILPSHDIILFRKGKGKE